MLVTAGIGLLLYMLLTRTTPVYAGSREIISDGSNFAVSASYYSGLDEQTVSADITFTNNNGVVTAAFAG